VLPPPSSTVGNHFALKTNGRPQQVRISYIKTKLSSASRKAEWQCETSSRIPSGQKAVGQQKGRRRQQITKGQETKTQRATKMEAMVHSSRLAPSVQTLPPSCGTQRGATARRGAPLILKDRQPHPGPRPSAPNGPLQRLLPHPIPVRPGTNARAVAHELAHPGVDSPLIGGVLILPAPPALCAVCSRSRAGRGGAGAA
jgi:hypothetical protein